MSKRIHTGGLKPALRSNTNAWLLAALCLFGFGPPALAAVDILADVMPKMGTIDGMSKNCPAGYVLQSITGNKPVCVPKQGAVSCPAGYVLNGIGEGGTANCVRSYTPPNNTGCSSGHALQGYDGSGAPVCTPVSNLNGGCPNGYAVQAFSNGSAQCVPVVQTSFSASCPQGQVLQGFSGGAPQCVSGPRVAQGTGCGSCPFGSQSYPFNGITTQNCLARNSDGALVGSQGVCRSGSVDTSFSFWTY